MLEIKGEDTEKERTKRNALDQWIKAVNNESRFGQWSWDVAFSPSEVRAIVNKHAEGQIEEKSEARTRCPLCGNEAKGMAEVERLFGYRNADGFVRVQSWCRSCRGKRSSLTKH